MTELVGFIGSAHKDRALNFDAQRCINMYAQVSSSGTAKTAAKLVGCPGLLTVLDKSSDGAYNVRGMIDFDPDNLFIVMGKRVYRYVYSTGIATFLGLVPYLDTPVCMCTNGVNVVFATGPQMWSINPATNVLAQYVDASFTGATAVFFVNGSYVFNQPDTGKFWVMDPYSMVLDPLNFATAEGAPDGLTTLAVVNQEIWLFGIKTIEVWAGDGTLTFPYSRIMGVFIEQGTLAPYSVEVMDGSVFWLSANAKGQNMVFRSVGYSPKRISTHSLEAEIATYSVTTDAVAFSYQQEGHAFYVLNFPTQDVTWVYDAATQAWHQRAWRKENGEFGRHRGNCAIFFQRMNLVGDWETGKIYQLSNQVYTDDGNPLVRLRSSPHVSQQNQRLVHSSFQVDIETGVGLPSGQGSNPLVMIRWSDDGGHTWSNMRTVTMGKIGEYKARARITRLGQSRDRVYEVSCSDPVQFTLLQAMLNVQ